MHSSAGPERRRARCEQPALIEQLSGCGPGDRPLPARTPTRRAVLIVEDDAELRRFAARLLEDGELDTIECESAEAALATMLIRGRDVAMIFADIRLPGAMDGIDLAREVRMRWPFLPVTLTGSHPQTSTLTCFLPMRMERSGAREFSNASRSFPH